MYPLATGESGDSKIRKDTQELKTVEPGRSVRQRFKNGVQRLPLQVASALWPFFSPSIFGLISMACVAIFLGLGQRHFLAVMAFFGIVNVYTMRTNMSLAIVAMVETHNSSTSNFSEACPAPQSSLGVPVVLAVETGKGPAFGWSPQVQGLILGSYFYGYIATQLFSGWLVRKIGGKYPFGIGILLCSIFTLVTPSCAYVHYGLIIALRVAEGLVTGFCYPAMQLMLAQWSPSMERTTLSTLANAGAPAGTVLVFAVSGVLADNLGWESIFYIFGGAGVVWFIFWQLFVHDNPHTNPRISKVEMDLITGSTIALTEAERKTACTRRTPWIKLVTSLPVWAMVLAHFGQNWGNYTLLTNLPTYMKNILHFNLSSNGLFSALPYLALWIISQVSGYISDYLRKGYLSTTNVRKLFNTVGNLVPAVALVAVGYIGCDAAAAIALLTIATGVSGCTQSSYQVNSIDLSPTFAPLIFGLSNTFANIPGILSPYTVGLITAGENGHTIHNWLIIFYISATVRVFSTLFYLCFASGETVSWNAEPGIPIPLK